MAYIVIYPPTDTAILYHAHRGPLLLLSTIVLCYYHSLDRASAVHGHERITVSTRVILYRASNAVLKFKRLL